MSETQEQRDARIRLDMGYPPPPSPAEAAAEAAEDARLQAAAAPLGLSVAEATAAERLGWSLEKYAALRDVRNVEQYRVAQSTLAAQADARAEAERQIAVDAMRTQIEREARS